MVEQQPQGLHESGEGEDLYAEYREAAERARYPNQTWQIPRTSRDLVVAMLIREMAASGVTRPIGVIPSYSGLLNPEESRARSERLLKTQQRLAADPTIVTTQKKQVEDRFDHLRQKGQRGVSGEVFRSPALSNSATEQRYRGTSKRARIAFHGDPAEMPRFEEVLLSFLDETKSIPLKLKLDYDRFHYGCYLYFTGDYGHEVHQLVFNQILPVLQREDLLIHDGRYMMIPLAHNGQPVKGLEFGQDGHPENNKKQSTSQVMAMVTNWLDQNKTYERLCRQVLNLTTDQIVAFLNNEPVVELEILGPLRLFLIGQRRNSIYPILDYEGRDHFPMFTSLIK